MVLLFYFISNKEEKIINFFFFVFVFFLYSSFYFLFLFPFILLFFYFYFFSSLPPICIQQIAFQPFIQNYPTKNVLNVLETSTSNEKLNVKYAKQLYNTEKEMRPALHSTILFHYPYCHPLTLILTYYFLLAIFLPMTEHKRN